MPDAGYPGDILYHADHDWARTDPGEDDHAELESVKAVSDIVAPLSGEVVEPNSALTDRPEAINEDPYGEGWLVRVRLSDPAEAVSLMDAEAYQRTLG